MNKIFLYLFSSIIFYACVEAQLKKNSSRVSTTSVAFIVNSPNQTGAWDDPDTDEDESADGICADKDGMCTLTAAMEEADNLNAALTVTFSESMTISLSPDGGEDGAYLAPLWNGSKIIGGDKIIVINGSPFAGPLELGDNCEVSGISLNNIPITMGSSNSIKGCTLDNSGQIPAGLIAIEGSNNIIGGVQPSERNVIKNGKGFGIAVTQLDGDGNNQILGNYIGINTAGNSANGNQTGILISSESGFGKNSVEGNVISGNTTNGIVLEGSNNNSIRKNIIGADAQALFAVPNKQNGIVFVNASHNTIENNIISGNQLNGILFAGTTEIPEGTSSNIVKNNFIGVNGNELPVPNNNFGILMLNNCMENVFGSSLAADTDTNVIAHNVENGIVVWQDNTVSPSVYPRRNIFRRNRMYLNGSQGIQLISGSQDSIQPPVIDSVERKANGEMLVHGRGRVKATVDVYIAEPNIVKLGEGKQWLKKGIVSDSGTFAVSIGNTQLDCSQISALQTDEENNTSANAINYGLRPNIVLLAQTCAPPLFGGIPHAYNKYTVHIDWKGMQKTGNIEFSLNGNIKNGILNGDLGEVEYNMSNTIAGSNTLTWKLTTCSNRIATGISSYEFCGNPVPDWLQPVTASCHGGHMQYSHIETFPDVPGAAEGLGIPPSIAFVGGLLLSFAGAPSFNTTLNIPGESSPIESTTDFKIGDFRTTFTIGGNISTVFNNCNNINATGLLTMSAGVSRTYAYGVNFGTIPCPSVPGLEQSCQIANALANSLRIGAILSGTITGTASLKEGIEITGGNGGATLALTPFLDVATFHARGTGQVGFNFSVPSFSITNVDASVTFTVSESISGMSRSWAFPASAVSVKGEKHSAEDDVNNHAAIPYQPLVIKSAGTDTSLEHGIAWNAEPKFAVSASGKKVFVWRKYKVNGQIKTSDIVMKYFNGTEWSSVIAITNDDNIDRNPSVIFDASEQILISWERNSSSVAVPDSLQNIKEVINQFKIMYVVYSPKHGMQIHSGSVGKNNTYNALPKLARGSDGSVMLAWQAGTGENLYGTDESPLHFVVAHQWNGSQWNIFDTLAASQTKMFQWDFAVHNEQNALIVYVKDTYGNLSTGSDWEIFGQVLFVV